MRERLTSRFGPLPSEVTPAARTEASGDRGGVRPATLRPRTFLPTPPPGHVPAGTTLLSRLNTLLEASRRLRKTAPLAAKRQDIAGAARACVEDVQGKMASIREAIEVTHLPPGKGDKAIRDMLQAQRELADAQEVLMKAQRDLIAAGHDLLLLPEEETGSEETGGGEAASETSKPGLAKTGG